MAWSVQYTPAGAGVKGRTRTLAHGHAVALLVGGSSVVSGSSAVGQPSRAEDIPLPRRHGPTRLPDPAYRAESRSSPFRSTLTSTIRSATDVLHVLLVVPWDQTHGGVNTVVRNLARLPHGIGALAPVPLPGPEDDSGERALATRLLRALHESPAAARATSPAALGDRVLADRADLALAPRAAGAQRGRSTS